MVCVWNQTKRGWQAPKEVLRNATSRTGRFLGAGGGEAPQLCRLGMVDRTGREIKIEVITLRRRSSHDRAREGCRGGGRRTKLERGERREQEGKRGTHKLEEEHARDGNKERKREREEIKMHVSEKRGERGRWWWLLWDGNELRASSKIRAVRARGHVRKAVAPTRLMSYHSLTEGRL